MDKLQSRTIVLPQRFDFDCHQVFNRDCDQLLEKSDVRLAVLDFSRVEYIDSAALGMLVLLHRKASPKGVQLVIRGAVGNAREILEIANIQRFFDMEI